MAGVRGCWQHCICCQEAARGDGDDSVLKNTGCSFRETGFGGGSHLLPILVSGGPMFFSGLQGYQALTLCTDMQVGKTSIKKRFSKYFLRSRERKCQGSALFLHFLQSGSPLREGAICSEWTAPTSRCVIKATPLSHAPRPIFQVIPDPVKLVISTNLHI